MARPRIIIVGGGFGGGFTARDLADAGDITLLSDQDHFLFKPLLYEYLSGEVEAWHIAPPYEELLDQQVKVVHSPVQGIDFPSRTVSLAGNETLTYDILVIALGATTNYAGVEGAQEF